MTFKWKSISGLLPRACVPGDECLPKKQDVATLLAPTLVDMMVGSRLYRATITDSRKEKRS
jgi:hypothetical protein